MARKKVNLYRTFRQLPVWQRALIVAGAVASTYGLYRLVKKQAELAKLRSDLKDYNRASNIITTPAGPVNLMQVAHNIYDAFYNNDWFGLTEDEDRAIEWLQRIPAEDRDAIERLAALYSQIDGDNMYSDVIRFLTPEDYARIAAWMQ